MEQQNRSALIVLVSAGHTAKDIVKLTKLPKATVFSVFKRFKEESKVDWKEHKVRSEFKRTPRFLAGLKHSIEANPSISMTTLYTVSRSVNRDLGMTSYVRRRRHLLTAKTKAIRVERYPKLLSFIKHQISGKALEFMDEKMFTVDAEVNRRNSGVIAYDLLTSKLCFRLRILPL